MITALFITTGGWGLIAFYLAWQLVREKSATAQWREIAEKWQDDYKTLQEINAHLISLQERSGVNADRCAVVMIAQMKAINELKDRLAAKTTSPAPSS